MKWKGNKQFEKAPPGSHLARCYQVIDMGTQPRTFEGKTTLNRMVRLAFELPEELMLGTFDENAKGRPFSVTVNCKQSLHPKAQLRKLLVGWCGRDFKDAAEIEAFDPRKLPGLPCRVTLVENGEYVNVDGLAPVNPKKEKVPKQVNASVFFSLDPDEFDEKVFDALPDFLKEKIKASPEYKALTGAGEHGEEPQPDATPDAGGGEGDPDVPF